MTVYDKVMISLITWSIGIVIVAWMTEYVVVTVVKVFRNIGTLLKGEEVDGV